MFFFTFQNFVRFLFPPKFFALRAKKKPSKISPSGEKTKTKMLGLQAKNSSNGGRCDGIIIVWEAGERAQRDFFYIWGYLSKKIRFRASKQSLKYLQNIFNFPQNLDFCFTKTYKIFSKMFKNFQILISKFCTFFQKRTKKCKQKNTGGLVGDGAR